MDSPQVRCRDCRHLRQGVGAPQCFGSCQATPWDGHRGQWPNPQHPCASFSPKPGLTAPAPLPNPEADAAPPRPACPSSVPSVAQGPPKDTVPPSNPKPQPGRAQRSKPGLLPGFGS